MTRLQLWQVLEQQALRRAEHWQHEERAARARLGKLEASRAHIESLYADYQRQRSGREGQAHFVASTEQLRHTQRQLLFLRERVDHDLARARAALTQVGAQRALAEQAHAKATKLCEREGRSLAARQASADQRQAEQAALQRYLARREAGGDGAAAGPDLQGRAAADAQLGMR